MIQFVTATRENADDFWSKTYLGQSLSQCMHLAPTFPMGVIACFNNIGPSPTGLSSVYNDALTRANPTDVLVFVHDDVYIHDWLVPFRILEGLRHYDVIGVVGGVNSDETQPSWALEFDTEGNALGWQPGLIRAGYVNHFTPEKLGPCYYGEAPAECASIDGLLLAAQAGTLQRAGVRFDERFKFHCYDTVFCRKARAHGLHLGVWPLAVTHKSGGNYYSQDFKAAAKLYHSLRVPDAPVPGKG